MSAEIKQVLYHIEQLLLKDLILDREFKETRVQYRNALKSDEGMDLSVLESQFSKLEAKFTQQINLRESIIDAIQMLAEATKESDEWSPIVALILPSIVNVPGLEDDERISAHVTKIKEMIGDTTAATDAAHVASLIDKNANDNRKLANLIIKHLPESVLASEPIKASIALLGSEHDKEVTAHRYDQKRSHFINRIDYINKQFEIAPTPWLEIDKSYKRLISQWQVFNKESKEVDSEITGVVESALADINTRLDPVRKQEHERREGYIKELAEKMDEERQLKNTSRLARDYNRQWKPLVSMSVEEEQMLWGRFKPLCDTIYERFNEQRNTFLTQLKTNHEKAEELLKVLEQVVADTTLSDDDKAKKVKALKDDWYLNSPLPKEHADTLIARFKSLAAPYQSHKSNKAKGNKNASNNRPDNKSSAASKKGQSKAGGPRGGSQGQAATNLWEQVRQRLNATVNGLEADDQANIKIPANPVVFDAPEQAIAEIELIAGLPPSKDAAYVQKRKLERLQLSLNGKLPSASKEAESVIAGFLQYKPASEADVTQWNERITKALKAIGKSR